jgi:hypothetical protein
LLAGVVLLLPSPAPPDEDDVDDDDEDDVPPPDDPSPPPPDDEEDEDEDDDDDDDDDEPLPVPVPAPAPVSPSVGTELDPHGHTTLAREVAIATSARFAAETWSALTTIALVALICSLITMRMGPTAIVWFG